LTIIHEITYFTIMKGTSATVSPLLKGQGEIFPRYDPVLRRPRVSMFTCALRPGGLRSLASRINDFPDACLRLCAAAFA